jgi:CubicO group peptidase (beta-lactamase class C family)
VEVIRQDHEISSDLAVSQYGEPVIDIWAGHVDAKHTRLWQRDTIVNLYSVGKAITPLRVLRQAEVGGLDLDTSVANYWAEFAQAGKERVPLRQILTHEPAYPRWEKLPAGASLKWNLFCAALAEPKTLVGTW